MRLILFLLLFCINQHVLSKLPENTSEVEVINQTQLPRFMNIPRISKTFQGARDQSEKEELEKKCRIWVMRELLKKEAPYFRAWCTLEKDVIIREYRYIGNILIKSW